MKDEIKQFIEFRTDKDGTYFYYNDKDNIEQWSYNLDNLKDYIINLQEELAFIKKDYKKVVNSNDDNIVIIYKAIEWVKKNMYYFPRPNELLNILQGVGKDE